MRKEFLAPAHAIRHDQGHSLQDTTELDFHGQGIAGLGRLCYEAQRGMYLHPSYVVTPDREPLGVVDAWMWAHYLPSSIGGLAKRGRPSMPWGMSR